MYKGTCLCGTIRFHITGPIRNIVYCHCSQCRKAQGSAFATNGIVEAAAFEILSGADALTGYESSPRQTKYFCRICGSPIMSKSVSKPDQVRVRLGTIESDITERPVAHIFATSKANWEEISGDLPQYEGYEPGREKADARPQHVCARLIEHTAGKPAAPESASLRRLPPLRILTHIKPAAVANVRESQPDAANPSAQRMVVELPSS